MRRLLFSIRLMHETLGLSINSQSIPEILNCPTHPTTQLFYQRNRRGFTQQKSSEFPKARLLQYSSVQFQTHTHFQRLCNAIAISFSQQSTNAENSLDKHLGDWRSDQIFRSWFLGNRFENGSSYPIWPLPVCPVCDGDLGLLWPNGWTDQDETWHWGRPRPRHIVLDGDKLAPPKKIAAQPPNFRPLSVVAKWLHGWRCHLVQRLR